MKIAAAFVNAKKSFAPAVKDKTNPAFRSRYADLGACIDAVEDALLANGIAAYHETFEDSTGVTVETVFLHESGEALRFGKLHVPASKQDPQGYGSALTYARRYSLMAACGIAPEDDDGNAASRPRVQKVEAEKHTPSVAHIVLNNSDTEALTEERRAELAHLAGNITKALVKKGAEWCDEQLQNEGLDDVELIYLSTLLSATDRRLLKEASIKRNKMGA